MKIVFGDGHYLVYILMSMDGKTGYGEVKLHQNDILNIKRIPSSRKFLKFMKNAASFITWLNILMWFLLLNLIELFWNHYKIIKANKDFCSQRKIWLYWYYAFIGVKCDDEPFFFKVSIIEF